MTELTMGEHLEQMELYRQECVKEGNLMGAEEAQAKIEEMRDQVYNEQRSQLLAHNDAEMSELIQQRDDTFNEFNQSWDDHETQLEKSSKDDIRALEEQHQLQLQQAREQAEAAFKTNYKPSSQLLNNRNVFQKLINQKKYAEAHALKAEIEQMEFVEQQKHMALREDKITKQMQKVLAKQKIEMASLNKKLVNQRHEQRRQREAEFVQLEKKFRNAEKEMDTKHRQTIVAHDKFYEKNISNRPRYQPEFQQRQSMAEQSMRANSSMARMVMTPSKKARKI